MNNDKPCINELIDAANTDGRILQQSLGEVVGELGVVVGFLAPRNLLGEILQNTIVMTSGESKGTQ